MTTARKPSFGTEDLEKGMRPSPASTLPTIALIALMMLAVFNSAGLARWTRELPPGTVNAWLAERAAGWHELMVRLGPASLYDATKRALRVM
jgi:hypothetical protein